MTIHSVGSRTANLLAVFMLATCIVVIFFILIAAIGQLIQSGGDAYVVFGMCGFWLLLVAFIWSLVRTVFQICVAQDGTVVFQRTIGSTTVPASTISQLEGRFVNGYDDQIWVMEIFHSSGRLKVSGIDEPRYFVDRLREFNPAVEITGLWPMGPP